MVTEHELAEILRELIDNTYITDFVDARTKPGVSENATFLVEFDDGRRYLVGVTQLSEAA